MKKSLNVILLLIIVSSLSACVNDQPVAINYNNDGCDYCKMTIVDSKFACEIKTNKGKAFKFDDLSCMSAYLQDNKLDASNIKKYFVSDFLGNNELSSAENMFYIKSENINSPMGGGIAAFANNDSAKSYTSYYNAESINWNDLIPE